MESILLIAVGICVFMFCVYFTRWVFGIDQIIQLQKEILKELKTKSVLNPITEHFISEPAKSQNNSTSKIMGENGFCPACNNSIKEFEKECSDCGLVVK